MKSRLEEQANTSSNKANTITQQLDEYSQMTFPWVGVSRPVSLLRAFLDFILPVVFGVGTIVLLLMADVAKGVKGVRVKINQFISDPIYFFIPKVSVFLRYQ